MARAHPVFLLTDFGLADVYVGVLKGVLLRLAPDAPIADLTHAVPPQDLGAGAFQLFSALPWLPEQAVVCVVVDPGVGTTRGVRLDRWAGRIVVSPDNGLVAWAFALLEAFRPPLEPAPCSCVLSDAVAARLLAGERPGTRRLNGSRKPGAGGGGGGGAGSRRSPVGASAWLPAAVPGLPTLGRTFDGRDRFAPLAARLTDAAVEARWKLTWRRRVPGEGATHDLLPAQQPDGHWRGGFLHFDHFGNGITNFSLAGWQPDRALFEGGKPVWKVRWNGWDLRLCRSYAGAGAGAGAEAAERAGTGTGRRSGARGSNRPVALVGSTGLLELAIPGGSFAGRFARELARPGGGVIRLVPHARG